VCQEVVSDFSRWCGDHFLDRNAQKTGEFIVDFRRDPTPLKEVAINGDKVKRVSEYKYISIITDSKEKVLY